LPIYWALDVAVDEASAEKAIEGASAAAMMTVLVVAEARPALLVAT
jgi:hypothetical protein